MRPRSELSNFNPCAAEPTHLPERQAKLIGTLGINASKPPPCCPRAGPPSGGWGARGGHSGSPSPLPGLIFQPGGGKGGIRGKGVGEDSAIVVLHSVRLFAAVFSTPRSDLFRPVLLSNPPLPTFPHTLSRGDGAHAEPQHVMVWYGIV